MKLYYAHYPALEDYLVQFVRQNRCGPVDKWLVVCASQTLAQHLQLRLARELGALANMHFITGGGLVARLDQEVPGAELALLPQNHVRDFLIKEILAEPGLDRYPVSYGLVQTLKSALRDLADSMATPAVLLEHLRSLPDFVLEQDNGRFEWLVHFYQRYCEKENSLPGFRSYQQAFERALGQVEKSAYLHEFSNIIIYGFYDMPGRQLELLSQVRAQYPGAVFAPYTKKPAYEFARKFFETNWLGTGESEYVGNAEQSALGTSADYLFAGKGSKPNSHVTIVSVPDVEGAVFYVVKEILKLQQQGHALGDIAVIARTLIPYQDEIRRIFKANCLPLDASFTYPIGKYALGLFVFNLLGLAGSSFSREKVLAVLSSPYLKQSEKAAWRHIVQKSLAKRDLSQWQDLLPQQGPAVAVRAWLEQIAKVFTQLNQPQSWQSGVQRLLTFLQEQVDPDAFEGKDKEIFIHIEQAFTQMATFQALRPSCREGEFLREALQAVSSLTFDEVEQVYDGIHVLDALRARGLSFKTVFLLGLNDKEFPLLMPEDPILRDYYRVQLRDTLGYWINPSLDRADEEKLLFYNAVTSATHQLHALYARYGQDGKPAVPSVYVAELARVCEQNLQAPDAPRVSGRLTERLASCPVLLLTEREISCQLALRPDILDNYTRAGLLTQEKERSIRSALALSRIGKIGEYDGIVRSGAEIFSKHNRHGFSPSALQEIGTCPLKYFFNRALGLSQPEEPANRHELPADKRGTAYHEILQDFYHTLYKNKLTHALFDAGIAQYMERSIAKFYTKNSYKVFGIYPVMWEMILDNISQKLIDFVTEDLKHLGTFTPTVFEKEVDCVVQGVALRLRGIIDRIDVDEENHQFYVVDYKSTRKGSGKLAQDIFTHLLLQPFVYVLLAEQLDSLSGYRFAGSCLLAISDYKKSELTTQDFAALRQKAFAFLVRLAELIKTGTFFISPSEQCAYCPYALLCRKDAFKPLLRARKSAQSVALEEVRR